MKYRKTSNSQKSTKQHGTDNPEQLKHEAPDKTARKEEKKIDSKTATRLITTTKNQKAMPLFMEEILHGLKSVRSPEVQGFRI